MFVNEKTYFSDKRHCIINVNENTFLLKKGIEYSFDLDNSYLHFTYFIHRKNGPAYIYYSTDNNKPLIKWFNKSFPFRLNGASIISPDGSKTFTSFRGEHLLEEEYWTL